MLEKKNSFEHLDKKKKKKAKCLVLPITASQVWKKQYSTDLLSSPNSFLSTLTVSTGLQQESGILLSIDNFF